MDKTHNPTICKKPYEITGINIDKKLWEDIKFIVSEMKRHGYIGYDFGNLNYAIKKVDPEWDV
jgi:hypothetical protein